MIEIEAVLPHRPPMLLLDRVDETVPGVRVSAGFTVRADDPWCGKDLVYPAPLVLESWLQAAAFLTADGNADERQLTLAVGITDARFLRVVSAGERIEHEVHAVRVIDGAAICAGHSEVDGVPVLSVGQVIVALRTPTDTPKESSRVAG